MKHSWIYWQWSSFSWVKLIFLLRILLVTVTNLVGSILLPLFNQFELLQAYLSVYLFIGSDPCVNLSRIENRFSINLVREGSVATALELHYIEMKTYWTNIPVEYFISFTSSDPFGRFNKRRLFSLSWINIAASGRKANFKVSPFPYPM